MLIAKDEDKSVVSVCFYKVPWQIDKQIATALNKVSKNKGLDGDMKLRHPGLEWIGIDKSALTSHCDYVQKMGWVATTPGSGHGVTQLVGMVKGLSSELLTSRLPCDYYLGELTIPDNEKAKYQVILDIVMHRMSNTSERRKARFLKIP